MRTDELERALERAAADVGPSSGGARQAVRRRVRRQRVRRVAVAACALAAVVVVLPAVAPARDRLQTVADDDHREGPGEDIAIFAVDGLTVSVWANGELTVRVVPELSQAEPEHRIAATGGRLVLFGDGVTYTLDPFGPGGPEPLRTARFFVPSTRGARVWLIGPEPGLGSVATEVDLEGVVTAGPSAYTGGVPEMAAGNRLILRDFEETVVWDVDTDTIERKLPGFPIATSGDRLAWCATGCATLHVTDLATGEDQTLALTEPTTRPIPGARGAFSQDGRRLAIIGPDRVTVLDVDDTGLRTVDVLPERAARVAWSPDGSVVVATYDRRMLVFSLEPQSVRELESTGRIFLGLTVLPVPETTPAN